MTLYAIERAMKPQFAWIKHPTRRLQTYDREGKKQGMAMVIFIGVAGSFGIPDKDIREFLELVPSEYETKKRKFDNLWAVILQRKENATICKEFDYIDQVYLKTKLTLNALNTEHRGSTLHCALAI